MLSPLPTTAYFISDAHLGNNNPYPRWREEWLLDFLERIQVDATHLFIVGDLFDFWIEYRHAIRPDYFNILWGLKTLRHKGVEIHYLAGNHDFALGPFLEQEIGVHLHFKPCVLTLQQQRLLISHGNGLLAGQCGDRFVQRQLFNPRWQKLYKLLHPNLGVPLGNAVSRLSRRRNKPEALPQWATRYRQKAHEYLQRDYDMVIWGHTHWPEICCWQINGSLKVYCNTGDWLDRFTYATLKSSRLQLWRYHPHNNPPSEILPQS